MAFQTFARTWGSNIARLTGGTMPLEAPQTPEYVPATAPPLGSQAQIGAALNGGSTDLQTMRAAGGVNVPTALQGYLPFLLIVALVLVILIKK